MLLNEVRRLRPITLLIKTDALHNPTPADELVYINIRAAIGSNTTSSVILAAICSDAQVTHFNKEDPYGVLARSLPV